MNRNGNLQIEKSGSIERKLEAGDWWKGYEFTATNLSGSWTLHRTFTQFSKAHFQHCNQQGQRDGKPWPWSNYVEMNWKFAMTSFSLSIVQGRAKWCHCTMQMSLSSSLTTAKKTVVETSNAPFPRPGSAVCQVHTCGHRPDSSKLKKSFSLKKLCLVAFSFKGECWLISRILEMLVCFSVLLPKDTHTKQIN